MYSAAEQHHHMAKRASEEDNILCERWSASRWSPRREHLHLRHHLLVGEVRRHRLDFAASPHSVCHADTFLRTLTTRCPSSLLPREEA